MKLFLWIVAFFAFANVCGQSLVDTIPGTGTFFRGEIPGLGTYGFGTNHATEYGRGGKVGMIGRM